MSHILVLIPILLLQVEKQNNDQNSRLRLSPELSFKVYLGVAKLQITKIRGSKCSFVDCKYTFLLFSCLFTCFILKYCTFYLWNSVSKVCGYTEVMAICKLLPDFNRFTANFTKWSNKLKQFVCNLLTNCLGVFDHFVGLVLEVLSTFLLYQAAIEIKFWKWAMIDHIFIYNHCAAFPKIKILLKLIF